MNSSTTVLAAAALLVTAATAQAAPANSGGAQIANPSVGTVAPLTPQLNPGAIGATTA
jgi:hypothetical protein